MVEGAPGIEELANEIDGYHYIYTTTDRGMTKDVYRVNDDRIAAVEYANEEWEEAPVVSLPQSVPSPIARERPKQESPFWERRRAKTRSSEWKMH